MYVNFKSEDLYMVIEPKVRGFICTTAHPEGCRRAVQNQIEVAKKYAGNISVGKRVLVIGASTGYGLATRIALAFGGGCDTLGVMYERAASGIRTASAGWYNTAAFEEEAKKAGLYCKSINGDAFSGEIKARTVEVIKRDLGRVDAVIYSLASPRRTMPDGTVYNSVLKTVNKSFTDKNIDLRTNEVGEITLNPATNEEMDATIKVMGGEDWAAWIDLLHKNDLLSENAITLAYSYLGPVLTHPIYLNGTIGLAKRDLYYTAKLMEKKYGITARVSVNKALVTQSSSAIPVVPLYISLLYKVMKAESTHEGCIEQMCRLYSEKLGKYDDEGYIRLDDYEMSDSVQKAVNKAWKEINTENLHEYADLDGYWQDFYNMFGFKLDGVDYTADVNPEVNIDDI